MSSTTTGSSGFGHFPAQVVEQLAFISQHNPNVKVGHHKWPLMDKGTRHLLERKSGENRPVGATSSPISAISCTMFSIELHISNINNVKSLLEPPEAM